MTNDSTKPTFIDEAMLTRILGMIPEGSGLVGIHISMVDPARDQPLYNSGSSDFVVAVKTGSSVVYYRPNIRAWTLGDPVGWYRAELLRSAMDKA